MSTIARQNTLFVSEDWLRIYEALQNVDFRAYDFDNLTQALVAYLRVNYPEEFNDWISSSEFISKIEILAWLSQNISFRFDLNARENFLATAERRDSLLRLAQNIAYKVNRVRGSSGFVKITSVRTTQSIIDSNNIDLRDKTVRWNDPRNEDWYEQFISIMNSALTVRTKFGKPLVSYKNGGNRTDQYVFNSIAPAGATYPFNASVNGVSLPFDIFNGLMDAASGIVAERAPAEDNAFNIFYMVDGKGFDSSASGFFFPIKQGSLSFQDEYFQNPVVVRTQDINTQNINNEDFFVQQIDDNGGVIQNWTQVDTVFGEGVSFNTVANDLQTIYEIDTLTNDQVRIRFGDGSFGQIPVGRFRFWYRTSNPQPLQVKPNAIQNLTVTLPYVSGNALYYLTLTYSLQDNLTNAAATESNDDIRTRANKAYYTQNRMITGEDYNNFFLTDNSILKVKSVNRTYSGNSRYSRLNDPTSLYQNVKQIAEDGRFYQNNTLTIDYVSANPDIVSIDDVITRYIKPILQKQDKQLMYYNKYTEIYFNNQYFWQQDSIVDGESRGNITLNNIPQVVGPTATNNLKYVNTNALIRYSNFNGPSAVIDRIVEGGTADDDVIFRSTIPDGVLLVSVLPPLRNVFTSAEQANLQTRLGQFLDFGISWNQTTQSWSFINYSDLNKTGDFSLVNQGDITGQNKDASWLILLEYLPGDSESRQWRITDRGLGLFIESAREIDFIFVDDKPVVDPDTGLLARDTIKLLASNESKNSLRRRGLASFNDNGCDYNAYTFQGDGITKCFKTGETLDPSTTIVLLNGNYQVYATDYTITHAVDGDSICFYTAPAAGSYIVVRISSKYVTAIPVVKTFNGDGLTTEFDLGIQTVVASNVVAFIDGISQTSSMDFGIGQIGINSSIVFNEPLAVDTQATCFVLGGIESFVFNKANYTGDGITQTFSLITTDQTTDSLFLTIDGVLQAPSNYTITATLTGTDITFVTAPGLNTKVRIYSLTDISTAKTKMYEFDANGSVNSFTLTGIGIVDPNTAIVTIDGVMQYGPWSTTPVWRITGNNAVFFDQTPPAGSKVVIYVISGASGILANPDGNTDIGNSGNTGNTDVASCQVSFIGDDKPLWVSDVIRYEDGYVNVNGVFVIPTDQNQDGFYDDPLFFRNFVMTDGITDLVLWRRIQQYGFDVYDPISPLTSPKGTYGLSANNGPKDGSSFDPLEVSDGDIHYDVTTQTWLVADGVTDTWKLVADQTAYLWKIGRDNLKIMWIHYAPEANRIDPSVSNIMNVYILTRTFDDAYRSWIQNNGTAADEPVPSTSEQLRIQYSSFENFKAQSDAIIYYPARYKPLFGDQAIPELRSTFKIIQTTGSQLSESDLRLRVLAAINRYFEADRWDFGESFYFTELCAYIHSQLAPDLQTVVIVPRDNAQTFGSMFQVRSESDELFISSAQPDDIEVVTSLSDEELHRATLV